MAKPLNDMQKMYINTNRAKSVDLLMKETGASKGVIQKYLLENPTVEPDVEAPKGRKENFLLKQGKDPKNKGVRVLTQVAAELGDEARAKYTSNKISKRYAESIMVIDPDIKD